MAVGVDAGRRGGRGGVGAALEDELDARAVVADVLPDDDQRRSRPWGPVAALASPDRHVEVPHVRGDADGARQPAGGHVVKRQRIRDRRGGRGLIVGEIKDDLTALTLVALVAWGRVAIDQPRRGPVAPVAGRARAPGDVDEAHVGCGHRDFRRVAGRHVEVGRHLQGRRRRGGGVRFAVGDVIDVLIALAGGARLALVLALLADLALVALAAGFTLATENAVDALGAGLAFRSRLTFIAFRRRTARFALASGVALGAIRPVGAVGAGFSLLALASIGPVSAIGPVGTWLALRAIRPILTRLALLTAGVTLFTLGAVPAENAIRAWCALVALGSRLTFLAAGVALLAFRAITPVGAVSAGLALGSGFAFGSRLTLLAAAPATAARLALLTFCAVAAIRAVGAVVTRLALASLAAVGRLPVHALLALLAFAAIAAVGAFIALLAARALLAFLALLAGRAFGSIRAVRTIGPVLACLTLLALLPFLAFLSLLALIAVRAVLALGALLPLLPLLPFVALRPGVALGPVNARLALVAVLRERGPEHGHGPFAPVLRGADARRGVDRGEAGVNGHDRVGPTGRDVVVVGQLIFGRGGDRRNVHGVRGEPLKDQLDAHAADAGGSGERGALDDGDVGPERAVVGHRRGRVRPQHELAVHVEAQSDRDVGVGVELELVVGAGVDPRELGQSLEHEVALGGADAVERAQQGAAADCRRLVDLHHHLGPVVVERDGAEQLHLGGVRRARRDGGHGALGDVLEHLLRRVDPDQPDVRGKRARRGLRGHRTDGELDGAGGGGLQPHVDAGVAVDRQSVTVGFLQAVAAGHAVDGQLAFRRAHAEQRAQMPVDADGGRLEQLHAKREPVLDVGLAVQQRERDDVGAVGRHRGADFLGHVVEGFGPAELAAEGDDRGVDAVLADEGLGGGGRDPHDDFAFGGGPERDRFVTGRVDVLGVAIAGAQPAAVGQPLEDEFALADAEPGQGAQ